MFLFNRVFLGLVTTVELDELVARIHLEKFGETIVQCRKRNEMQWSEDQPDYGKYDVPAFERIKRGWSRLIVYVEN
jgi:hypothetical protein